ncbi:MAG: hypothetical protein ACE5HD_07650 [Acidobacteriota bacterium]
MKLSTLYRDGRRLLRAFQSHRREARRAVCLDLGLAFLEVGEETARPGCDATYRTAVTDLGLEARRVELVLDFWIHEAAAAHHVGYLLSHLATEPRARVEVEMIWNGVDPATARWGNRPIACQTCFGEVNHPGGCDVILTLRHDSRVVDEVRAWQQREAVPA